MDHDRKELGQGLWWISYHVRRTPSWLIELGLCPRPRGLSLLFPGGSTNKGSILSYTASRKPDIALMSLPSVALSSISGKYSDFTIFCKDRSWHDFGILVEMCIQDVAILGVMPHFFSIADFLQKLFHTTTIFCTQFDVPGWHDKFSSPLIADAICDRIAHDSYRILIESTESMRKRNGVKA